MKSLALISTLTLTIANAGTTHLAPINKALNDFYIRNEAGAGPGPMIPKYTPKRNNAIQMLMNFDGSSGTGFFIRHNGRVVMVTAAHVCGGASVLYSAKGLHEVLAMVPERDTCILSTYQTVETLKLGYDLEIGQLVHTIGFPYRLEWDYSEGIAGDVGISLFLLPGGYYNPPVRSLSEALEAALGPPCPKNTQVVNTPEGLGCGVGVTTTSAKMLVRPGNSGGPAMDYWGRVTGIVIGSNPSEGTGFIVPISEVQEVLKDVK